jgi:hypothetical protein
MSRDLSRDLLLKLVAFALYWRCEKLALRTHHSPATWSVTSALRDIPPRTSPSTARGVSEKSNSPAPDESSKLQMRGRLNPKSQRSFRAASDGWLPSTCSRCHALAQNAYVPASLAVTSPGDESQHMVSRWRWLLPVAHLNYPLNSSQSRQAIRQITRAVPAMVQ